MLRSSSICASFLYNYLLSDIEYNDNGQPLDKKCQKLRCLSKTLESYGGVLSKLSQMLSLNDQDSSVFSDCKPFSKDKTIKYFQTFINNSNYNLDFVDFNVYKSGSVGQVHKAMYKNNDIIFKVQYVGLAEQTRHDLDLLDSITSYLYHFADMKHAMVDIKTKMYEELNYQQEVINQQIMENLYKNSNFIEIPKVIPELSTNNIIAMNFVNGTNIVDFINNSTQEQRNKLGMCIVKFIFENIYKHGILYSDVHYGNIIVKDDSTLCMIDFGCLHKIDKHLVNNLCLLHQSISHNDKTYFYELVENIGVINKNISPESKQYIYEYFRIQYEPWIVEEFEFTEQWLDNASNKKTEFMKEWTLPQNMVYFNKIPYGAYHILTKLKLRGKFLEVFDNIFNSIKTH